MDSVKIKTQTSNPFWPYLLLALVALIIVRLLPLIKSPLSYYGYDYGFYFDAAAHAGRYHITDLFENAVWGGYNNPLFLLGSRLRLPPAILVSELYFLASLALGLAMYAWMKLKNPLAGVLAALLVAASFVQTSGYLMYLWKNILALPILILGFKFLEQKKYWQLAVCFLAVAMLHRTTAILFGLSLIIYFAAALIRQKKIRLLGGLLSGAILMALAGFYGLHLKSVILNLIYNNNYYVTTGLFMEGQNFWQIWWPLLLLAAPGLYFYVKKYKDPLLPIFTALLLLWIAFKFPFYRRMLLYLDVCLVGLAAYFLSLLDYSKAAMKAALALILAVLLLRSGNYALNQQPLISTGQVAEIKNFRPTGGLGMILAVSANDAPWLLAFTRPGQRLGAPGLLEDPHTYPEWINFWNGQNQRQFLADYPRPLYFYQRGYRLPPQGVSQCLIPLSENFFQLDYSCLETNSGQIRPVK